MKWKTTVLNSAIVFQARRSKSCIRSVAKLSMASSLNASPLSPMLPTLPAARMRHAPRFYRP